MGARLQVYQAGDLTVTFDPTRCIHSGVCVRGLPQVFNPRERRWVRLEAASAEEIVDVVARCPTGALQSRRIPTDASIESSQPAVPTPDVTITLSDNGPLLIRGRVRIVDSAGALIGDESRVALCRCGHTANPPYCDGSHGPARFRPSR